VDQQIVHIIDDDPDILTSLAFLLRSSPYETATYRSAEEFERVLPGLTAGCILLDLRMPGTNGLELQHRLVEKGCDWPVIMMTGHGDVASAVRAMKEGAIDFLQKPFSKADLEAAITQAFERLSDHDLPFEQKAEAIKLCATLTRREREVVQCLTKGLVNKEIARDMGISPRTVEVHRSNASHKLGARNLSELLNIAFLAGFRNGSLSHSSA